MMHSRRSVLGGLAATGAALGAVSEAKADRDPPKIFPDATQNGQFDPPFDVPRPEVLTGLLLHKERARAVLEEAQVDLIICARPVNYFYLTGHQPGAHLLGYDAGIDLATLSAHDDGKPTMITSQIGLYFQGTAKEQLDHLNVAIVGFPADMEGYSSLTDPQEIASTPGLPFTTRRNTLHPETASEAYRHALITRGSEDIRGSIEAATLKQLLDNPLPNKTVAVDDPRVRDLLKRSGIDLKFVDGEQLIRKIRVQKSPMELKMMRYAAAANAAAGRAAAMSVRDGASFQDLRDVFWQEAAKRGNTGHFMMIDTLMSRLSTGEIKDGRTFLIDCVSTFHGYHGDYGRTVCVGEPNRDMAKIIAALSTTWDRLRSELKIGMRFSEILARGNTLFADTNIDVGFALNPHTIGLHHSDDANVAGFGNYKKADIALEENMVLSIDMPLLDSGLGGSAHLEDLVIITKDGPELINDTTDRFIMV